MDALPVPEFRALGSYQHVVEVVNRYVEKAELDPEGRWFLEALEVGGRELRQLSQRAVRENSEYIRDAFRAARRKEPMVDCLLLDREGGVRQVWTPDQETPRYADGVRHALTNRQLVYLAYSPDAWVFVLDRDMDKVAEVLGETRGFRNFYDEVGAEHVVNMGFVDPGVLDTLKFNKVPTGDGKHRKVRREDLAVGRIVYLQDEKRTYRHPHVRIDGHPAAQGKRIWITQFKDYVVLASGGQTMTERHGDLRIEVEPNPDNLPNMVVEGFKEYIKQPGGQVPLVMVWTSSDRSK